MMSARLVIAIFPIGAKAGEVPEEKLIFALRVIVSYTARWKHDTLSLFVHFHLLRIFHDSLCPLCSLRNPGLRSMIASHEDEKKPLNRRAHEKPKTSCPVLNHASPVPSRNL